MRTLEVRQLRGVQAQYDGRSRLARDVAHQCVTRFELPGALEATQHNGLRLPACTHKLTSTSSHLDCHVITLLQLPLMLGTPRSPKHNFCKVVLFSTTWAKLCFFCAKLSLLAQLFAKLCFLAQLESTTCAKLCLFSATCAKLCFLAQLVRSCAFLCKVAAF